MGIIELFLLAVGLSMDAFAVSIANGLSKKNINGRWIFSIALCFGVFQGAMPIAGFVLGSAFSKYITSLDHIFALVLLGYIGGKMLYDGIKNNEEESGSGNLTVGELLVQGVATSIDALAVGISLAALKVNIVTSALFICCITFCFGIAGVIIGKKFGDKLSNKAQILGGLILVGIGLKIFIEHVFFNG